MTRSSWSRQRRVVAKAEWTKDEASPRFVVTSLTRAECKARYLYEKVYCACGDMENRIKECQLDLYADRTSTATMRANQLRLWFASMAYVLLCALRRIGKGRSLPDVIPLEPQTVGCTPQGNIELMSEKEILHFEPAPRPEQVSDKCPKQMEYGQHRAGSCADSASSCESERM
jgi:hypothetical protein